MFDELETKVKVYERAHFVQFWKQDAWAIKAAKKRLNKSLKSTMSSSG